jgi:uncharacterized protein with HEPN domain
MEISPQLYLLEIQRAAGYILRRTDGRTLQDYLSDEDLRFAVERNFILIGEAMVLLRRYYPDMSKDIEDEMKVIGFRNVLVHHYWNVDNKEVWSIIVSRLGLLRDAITRILLTTPPVPPIE